MERGPETMAEFGDFPGYESRVYRFPVYANAVPAVLSIIAAGGDREFVIVPSSRTDQAYPEAFQTWSRSAALGATFRYLDYGVNEIALCGPSTNDIGQSSEVAIAVIRWARASRAPFPTAAHCLQRVSVGNRTLLDIVPAAGDTEGAQR